MENPMNKWMILGVPSFLETPKFVGPFGTAKFSPHFSVFVNIFRKHLWGPTCFGAFGDAWLAASHGFFHGGNPDFSLWKKSRTAIGPWCPEELCGQDSIRIYADSISSWFWWGDTDCALGKQQTLLIEATTNRWWNLRSRLVRFSNIFDFHPEPWRNDPNWWAYFSNGWVKTTN